jgi:hypothetical protein
MKPEQYIQTARKLADYLAFVQKEDGSFPDRVTYGFTFSALFWLFFNKEKYNKNIDKALNAFNNQDKHDKEFPWEFNNYAILKIIKYYPQYANRLCVDYCKNKGTPVTNWRLLRVVNEAMVKGNITKYTNELKTAIRLITNDGFICDEPNTRSFQYHCFSTFLIGQLYIIIKYKPIGKIFLKSALWIADKILSNGQTLYLGRGQEQIFGYGALLFVLELAYKLTDCSLFSEKATKVLDYLVTFQRDDGSFPLVLRYNDKEHQLTTVNDKPYGWFSYNTLFDYLPFLGYCLTECIRISKISIDKFKHEEFHICQSPDIFYIKKRRYEAVWTIPTSGKGYWNDELPVPLIIKDNPKTPIYGGDPIWTDIYSPGIIPLPYGILNNSVLNKNILLRLYFMIKTRLSHWCYRNYYRRVYNKGIPYFFANQLNYKKTSNGFIGENIWLLYERKFCFEDKNVEIIDTVRVKKKIVFSSFYPINLFFFYCRNIKELDKEFLVLRYQELEIRIEGIKGRILIDEQASPAGRLTWIREDISTQFIDTIERKVKILLK